MQLAERARSSLLLAVVVTLVAAVPPRAVPERPRADAPTLDLTPAQPFALDMNVDDEMVRALRDMCRANRQGSPGSWAC